MRDRDPPTPVDAMVRLVRAYARKVRSDARWSRATLPEFSSVRQSFHSLSSARQRASRRGPCPCARPRFRLLSRPSPSLSSLSSSTTPPSPTVRASRHRPRPIPNSYWATPYLVACEFPYCPLTPAQIARKHTKQKLDALLLAGVLTSCSGMRIDGDRQSDVQAMGHRKREVHARHGVLGRST